MGGGVWVRKVSSDVGDTTCTVEFRVSPICIGLGPFGASRCLHTCR